jgi:hypothetical protein
MRRFNECCLLFLLCAFNYSPVLVRRGLFTINYSLILKEEICRSMNTNVKNAVQSMSSSSLPMMIHCSVNPAQART